MDLMESISLIKDKIAETDGLITKCQTLQNQLEISQKDQARQQMELKLMENENALLLSAKRKFESELLQKMEMLKAHENTIKQCTAKINELEKIHDRDSALIKTLQSERDTAVSENRKVSSNRYRSLKARSKQTQTELLVHVGNESKIIIPNFQPNCRQRRRRSSQAASRSTDNEATELIFKTPTIMLPPAERASTPKSSCSEGADGSSGGEDITENEMPWLAEITEQPIATPPCNVTHSESELDDSNDSLLLPYNTMDLSISPLPPTPGMNLDGETTERINTSSPSKDVSTQSDHYISDDGLMKECHLSSDSSVVAGDQTENLEESTLISSQQLSNDDDSNSVVVTTNSAKSLLEEATGVQGSLMLEILSKDSQESCNVVLDTRPCNEEACKSHTHDSESLAVSSSAASVPNPSKPVVVSSCNNLSDHQITVPVFTSHAPSGLTSPKALRSGFGKSPKVNKTYPSFLVDSHRESMGNTRFNKDKHNRFAKKQIGNLNKRQLSPLYFPSIAERTRSQASKCNSDTLLPPKVTKQAKRQLNKLEITMNAFKSNANIQNEDGLHHHEICRKQIVSPGSRDKKDTEKRKRPQKQSRLDSKKKRFNSNNHQRLSKAGGYTVSNEPFNHPTQLSIDRASMSQSSEVENKENDGSLNRSEGETDTSDGELDSSNGSKYVNKLERIKDKENNEATFEKSSEDKLEDSNVDELINTKESEDEDESVAEGELSKNGKQKMLVKEDQHAVNKEMRLLVNKSELKEKCSKIENMIETLESSNEGELEETEYTEEKFKEGNNEEKLDNASVVNMGDMLEADSEGDLRDISEDEESEADNSAVGEPHEDKDVGDDRSEAGEDNIEKKDKENNKSDGELDSEEDEVSLKVAENASEISNQISKAATVTSRVSNQMPKAASKVSSQMLNATENASEVSNQIPSVSNQMSTNASEISKQMSKATTIVSPGRRQGLFNRNKPNNELSMLETTDDNDDDDDDDPPHTLLKESRLPGWLEWTINEEEKTSNAIQRSFITEQKRKKSKNKHGKSQAQKTMHYLLVNLEHLLLKTLKFEKVLDMFSDPCNVDNTSDFANALAKFLVEALHPSFENVASKLAERCNKATCHNAKIFPHYKPLNENFHPVMLTFESHIIAMLMVIEKHNPKLDNVMGCVVDTLRCTLFMSLEDNNIDVHKQCSLIRVITGISRVVGKIDFMQRLCLDLISLGRPLKISQLPLLQAVAGVWPLVLARKEDVKLYGLQEVLPEGLEPQIVSHTVEVTTCYLIGKQDSQEFNHLLFKTFVSFCRWQQLSSEDSMHSLATALVKILTSSPNVTLTSVADSMIQGKWISPQLSATTHMCITCLAVIGRYLGWKWISDNLIRKQLWPLLQKWSKKAMGQEVSEAVITAITQLIGLVGKQGMLHDPTCQSVKQLQKMLSSLLQRAHDSPEVTLSIQLAVAESLISLCPSQSPVAKEVLQNWLTGIKTHHPYAAQTIWEDFAPRVWHMRTATNESTSDEKTY